MFYYKIYDMKVESDLEFLQLLKCEDDRDADVQIMKAALSEEIKKKRQTKIFEVNKEYGWLANKTCQLQVYNGKKITYALTGEGKPKSLQSYILGFGMAMLGLQQGKLPIHSGAVADKDGAILVCGDSGAGKSTISTAFLNSGYRLMADDLALVDNGVVYPAFPFQKLCRNVAMEEGYNLDELIYINEERDKFLVPYRGEFLAEKEKLKGFIFLQIGDKDYVEWQEVTGLESFYVIMYNVALRRLLKGDVAAPWIGKLCLEMASKVPVLCIKRPRDVDTTKEVIEIATEWASKIG